MVLILLVGTVAILLLIRRRDFPLACRDWQQATVTTLREAEELLDALENQGYAEREVELLGNSCITVCWR